MCNRYNVRGSATGIGKALGAKVQTHFTWDADIFVGSFSPGVMVVDGERELLPMQFGLTPPWARERFNRRYPNNNARIEGVTEKKTFKEPFLSRHCVAPVSSFQEYAYWGDYQGKALNFSSAEDPYLGVASIYNVWKPRGEEEAIVTMCFLMRPACEFLMDCGHHRQPFFIQPDGFDEWMEPKERSAIECRQIIAHHAYDPPLEVEVVREMKSGWEKRQAGHIRKRDEQLAAIETSGSPLGLEGV